MVTPDDPVSSRRLVLGTGAALGAGLLLGAAGCSAPPPAARPSAPAPGATGSSTATTTTPATSAPATPAPPTSPAAGPDPRPALASSRGPDITSGPRHRDEVALTFHGQGSAALTDAVRAACREASAAVTVFAVGTWVDGDPALAVAIRGDGHELGNHTWSHQQMPGLGASAARTEVRRGRDALTRAVGSAGWWFRPSGTQHSTATIRSAARAAGYARCVSYDVDPHDYLDPGARLVRSRVRRAVRGGSIVSLHLGHAGTAEALPGILSDLTAAGLQPVTLSRLLRD
jgi:peptidoglycan/xylan/chitin deacetylase (PgdA/CDA1 family)